jgi:hypothetical protein
MSTIVYLGIALDNEVYEHSILKEEITELHNRAIVQGTYHIYDRDHGTIVYTGTFYDCCDKVYDYETTIGECVILKQGEEFYG